MGLSVGILGNLRVAKCCGKFQVLPFVAVKKISLLASPGTPLGLLPNRLALPEAGKASFQHTLQVSIWCRGCWDMLVGLFSPQRVVLLWGQPPQINREGQKGCRSGIRSDPLARDCYVYQQLGPHD
eukprot:1144451-Pelagomonas_calceolata.AAC.5